MLDFGIEFQCLRNGKKFAAVSNLSSVCHASSYEYLSIVCRLLYYIILKYFMALNVYL